MGLRGRSISSKDDGSADMPRHVAIIMDGNGRWAAERGKLRLSGHNAGMNAMTEIVRYASDSGVEYLTVYAFSTENWKRSSGEVSGIFGLVAKFVEMKLRELMDNNVRVLPIGDYSPLPPDARAALDRMINTTSENTGMRFIIALNYGSRAEITKAARLIAEDAVAGRLDTDEVTEDDLSSRLFTGGFPDPDLIIRSGGEQRLSNFLLWQSAYSEFVFTDVLWPDFGPAEFDRCIEEYKGRVRRYGGR
jgi:undecaprenyl diphosphate synthase